MEPGRQVALPQRDGIVQAPGREVRAQFVNVAMEQGEIEAYVGIATRCDCLVAQCLPERVERIPQRMP